ncbi:hypothetical protein C7974DRAFT_385919 [Boeremia exigua]|uniref:uncharacterized protein n=1 Tax=Boeremia exigua TaxID=749465 RepID=UPI001E8DDE9A|nr:uncharacterized protein C7974DRAFT_385919 [Boeremia exigua]KAH6642666.1 hypothetical protein C7974DRAFT_385919 [Boeremia exigua]
MRSTTICSTLLLLAGAAAAQSESVVSEIPSTLIQTTEQVFTIQTSVPTGASSVCYEVCIQEPCNACSAAPTNDPGMSLPAVSLPVPSNVSFEDVTMTLPVESLPSVGSEPAPTASVTGTILPPISQMTDPPMSIPQGETPEPTSAPTTSSGSGNATASVSRTAPAEQSTAAAPPSVKRDSTPFLLALGVSGASIFFGAAWTLL